VVLRYCKKLRVPTNPLNPSFCFRGRSSATSVGASGETPQLTGISRFLGTRNLHHRSQQTFHCKTQQPEDSLFCQLPNFQLPETCGSFIIAPFLFSVKGSGRNFFGALYPGFPGRSDFQEVFVHPCVLRKLGMERASEDSAVLHHYRLPVKRGEEVDLWTGRCNLGCPDEHSRKGS